MVNSVELMQLCRLCLVKDEVNIPIFDNETDVQQIFLKISTCLPVKVTQDDNLPKKICNDCSYKLDLCYQFWNTSANSEKQLVTWLNEVGLSQETLNEAKLQKTESNSTPGLVLKQETIEPESESSHEVVNNVSTESQEYILQQQQLPYQTPAFPFTDDNFVSGESANAGASKTHTNNKRESTLKRKRQAVATVTQPDSDDDVDEDIDDPTETKVAKTEETSDDDRDDDGLNDEESTEFAGVPSTSTDNEQPGPSGIGKNVVDAPYKNVEIILVSTNEGCHSNGKMFKCSYCDRTFTRRYYTQKHEEQVHMKPTSVEFSCSVCGKSYKQEKYFVDHMSRHRVDCYHYCPNCGRAFISNSKLQNHIERTHTDVLYECDKCGKLLKNKFTFIKHLNIHQNRNSNEINKKAFVCQFCEKTYFTKTSLVRHVEEHLGKKESYVCDICGKAISSIESLRNHLLVHENNKSYECVDCGKRFNTSSILHAHRKTHAGVKKFVCEVCGKRFVHRSPFVIHKRIHTGEKPYECDICEKCFISKMSLNAHKLKKHKILRRNLKVPN
ncbi:zinc finger protein 70 isoform X26 [Agrilus planipennis]|uniref:Zinc finger protein 70 isoform X26 n=1 Tax=Agrilus planipennis TaxID=224129 RepID=A0A1W4XSD6_AGRPL|nr:zinc finger protein 70 isoform X26 [Agrilus planipennis]